jgi:hypothetical protein
MTSRLVSPNIRWLRGTRAATSHTVVLEELQLHSDFARAMGAKNPDDTAGEEHLPFMQTAGEITYRESALAATESWIGSAAASRIRSRSQLYAGNLRGRMPPYIHTIQRPW